MKPVSAPILLAIGTAAAIQMNAAAPGDLTVIAEIRADTQFRRGQC
jgi:hypothetical protein